MATIQTFMLLEYQRPSGYFMGNSRNNQSFSCTHSFPMIFLSHIKHKPRQTPYVGQTLMLRVFDVKA